MTNDSKKPGAEPGESQARLDEAHRRLDEQEKALESLSAKTSKNSSALSEELQHLASDAEETAKALSEQANLIKEQGTQIDEVKGDLDSKGEAIEALVETSKTLVDSHQNLTKSVGMLTKYVEGQDQTIALLMKSHQSAIAGQAKTDATISELMGVIQAGHGLIEILVSEMKANGIAFSGLGDKTVSLEQAVRLGLEGVSGELIKSQAAHDYNTRQINGLRTSNVRIAKVVGQTQVDVAAIRKDVSRILQVAEIIANGIEAAQVYLAELQFSLKSVEKSMLTTETFFEINDALKDDLIKAMGKAVRELPDELRQAVKEIVREAAVLKQDVQAFADTNKSQLSLLQSEVAGLITFMSNEGRANVDLLKSAAKQFNTELSTKVGQAQVLMDENVATFVETWELKMNRMAKMLKEGDFYKLVEELHTLHGRSETLTQEVSATIAAMGKEREGLKAEITSVHENTQISVKQLYGEVHNARNDMVKITTGLSTALTNLETTEDGIKAIGKSAVDMAGKLKEVDSVVSSILNTEAKGRDAFVNGVVQNLRTLIAADVEALNEGLAERFAISRVIDDIDSNSDE